MIGIIKFGLDIFGSLDIFGTVGGIFPTDLGDYVLSLLLRHPRFLLKPSVGEFEGYGVGMGSESG